MKSIIIKSRRWITILCVIALVAFISCSKDPDNSNDADDNNPAGSSKNELTHQLARMIAASTVSVEGKNFIKEEVKKQFDGDYNFLFAESIEKPVESTGTLKSSASSGETFGSFLGRYANMGQLKSSSRLSVS